METSGSALVPKAYAQLGPVRLEWVYDGRQPWVVQLHCGASQTVGDEIYPGQATRFVRFAAEEGLEGLRRLIDQARGTVVGIVLAGQVGLASHMGDLLRKAKIPSRLERR
jgi:hypothetical protein